MARLGNLCVLCSSSPLLSTGHLRLATKVGRELAQRGWDLIFGGDGAGMMGAVAVAASRGGAEVTAVITSDLHRLVATASTVGELIVVDNLLERRVTMFERAAAFLILPGGPGTLAELAELILTRNLGVEVRPVVVLDPRGFWDPLWAQLQAMAASGLGPPDLPSRLSRTRDIRTAFDGLARPGPPPLSAAERS